MINKVRSFPPAEWLRELTSLLENIQAKVDEAPTDFEYASACIGQLFSDLRARDATLWMVGNGGSAAICSHLCQDFMNKLQIRAMQFNDASLITCTANDYGYDEVYAKPLRTMARKGDVLVAISSSGMSGNILACANVAKEMGLHLATFSGFTPDNKLWQTPAAVSFYLPSFIYGLVETGHQAILHAVLESLCLGGCEE